MNHTAASEDVQSLEQYQRRSYQLINQLKESFDVIKNSNFKLDNTASGTGGDQLIDLLMRLKQESSNIDTILSQQDQVIEEKKKRNDTLNDRYQSLFYQKDVLQTEIDHLQQSFSFDLNDPSLNLNIPLPSSEQQQDNSHLIIESLEKEMSLRIKKLNELEEWKQSCKKAKEELAKKQKELETFESKLKSNHITLQQIIKPLQPNISAQPLPSLQPQQDGGDDESSTPPLSSSSSSLITNQLLALTPSPLYNLYYEAQGFKDLFYNRLNVDIKCNIDIESLKNQLYRDGLESFVSPPFSLIQSMDVESQKQTITTSSSQVSLEQPYTPFPISINISIPSVKNHQTILLLEFYYYPILKLVTVHPSLDGNVQAGQKLLEPLGEKGSYNHYLFDQSTEMEITNKLIGQPFIWAQYITGLSFLPDLKIKDISNKDYNLHDFKPKTSNEVLSEIITSF